ncbi:cation:proton antiporter [Candidatus Nitrosocaldus cavascurensis]|uniref:Putative Cation:Proton Antiporter-2 (CPA2) Family protein n=1 Tax=Candidatus Nitrosocaldus cavascurensis TaxID=2058097 RepID=A0A2K5APW6_9ARCH|nr:cation:proton antiporter [Candidatus Nitrosocaldus cavascurensis]SPC33691.1 putative Cation:Proton Antiporter-2 (CPA2) Family protein [Candidatus Nitrosocaldus cavascurensis]
MANIISSVEFMLLLTILLGSAILGSLLARKARLPSVIGFILVGMAIGPYGFKVVTDVQIVSILADIGVILLVFVVGLELNINRFRRVGGVALIGAVVEIGVVFFLGFIVAVALGFNSIEAIYLGGIISITSTAIVLKLLKDAGILHTREGEFIIVVSIVEDIFSIILLVILPGIVKSGTTDLFSIGLIIAQSVTFFIITLVIGLKVVPRLIEYVSRLDLDEAPLLLAIVMGFGLALLANYLGLSMAIGAFLMGMMIASSPRASVITEKVVPLRDLFGTVFFISIGMLISLNAILDNLIISLPIVVIAILSKFIGNFIAISIVGYGRDSASTVGIMMMPRGELSFVMAKQGIDLNATRESMMPITMLVSLASIFVIPLFSRALPTIVDPRSIIPIRLLNMLEAPARVTRGILQNVQQKDSALKVGRIFSRLLINMAIIVAMITIVLLSDGLISLLYNTFSSLKILPYNIFKIVFMIGAVAYPLLNILGRAGEITDAIFEEVQRRIVRYPVITRKMDHLHRVIRNIVLSIVVLIVTSFVIPSLAFGNMDIVLPASIAAVVIFVYLLLDTFIVVNRRIEKSLIDILVKDDGNDT